MNLAETVFEGTLKSDGTLELDEKPKLPPGRVKVIVQTEDWLSYLKRCRAELELSGATFRRGIDIEADIEFIRGETERVDGIRWEQEWANHHPEAPLC
jgi:hypothetical protein